MNEFDTILMCFLVLCFAAVFYISGKGDVLNLIVLMLQEKTKELEENQKRMASKNGCEYCAGGFAEYQHTYNTKLYINTLGEATALETECNPCPPYSDCSMKGKPARSAFIINYCPHCGRKLGGGAADG